MPKKPKESEEIQRLRKELLSVFNVKLKIKCFVEGKINSFQKEIREARKEVGESFSDGEKNELLREMERSNEFWDSERRTLTRKVGTLDKRLNLSTDANEELVKVNEILNENVKKLTEEVKALKEREQKNEKDKEEMKRAFKEKQKVNEEEKGQLWSEIEILKEENDSLHQYGRRETLVLHNVPMKENENTMQVALSFIWSNLGLNIPRHYVSTCHRNYPPKNTYPENCPPIYIKFVIRDIKKDCLKKKKKTI